MVSRSDIRYVGTLHEINSETSTVALENVTSYGTEGRKGNADEEIPASDSIYEYIVFRGSDVKDLRIEEAPAIKENQPPQVPNDPAILGSGSRPVPQHQQPQAQAQAAHQIPPQQAAPHNHAQQTPGGSMQQQQQFPPQFYPPPGQWGRGGPPPPGPGFQGVPYGAPPPGWYPPPGQGFPQPGPGPFPYGPYGPFPQGPPPPPGQQFPQQNKPMPIGSTPTKQGPPGIAADKNVEPKTLSAQAPQASAQTATASTGENTALSRNTQPMSDALETPAKPAAPTGPKNGRIPPALPLASPNPVKTNNRPHAGPSATAPTRTAVEDATQAATAAVAAAMAKLPPIAGQQQNGTGVDNLTNKVNQMRINDTIRAPRQPGVSGFGGRGAARGRGGPRQETRKVEVPKDDFDFESSNAKFNKQDLVKEAIASAPVGELPTTGPADVPAPEVPVPAASYNKASSFFDDLSSESKDRAEGEHIGRRPGGREWRGEEQKKNLETFGQGSVDNGYRGGFRGRGRGRGGMRGRGNFGNGQPARGRGVYRGPRDDDQ